MSNPPTPVQTGTPVRVTYRDGKVVEGTVTTCTAFHFLVTDGVHTHVVIEENIASGDTKLEILEPTV
jgi:hypothetical protein